MKDWSAQFLRSVLDVAPEGIVICEAEGDQPVVYVNAAFEYLTGHAAEDLLGRNAVRIKAAPLVRAMPDRHVEITLLQPLGGRQRGQAQLDMRVQPAEISQRRCQALGAEREQAGDGQAVVVQW